MSGEKNNFFGNLSLEDLGENNDNLINVNTDETSSTTAAVDEGHMIDESNNGVNQQKDKNTNKKDENLIDIVDEDKSGEGGNNPPTSNNEQQDNQKPNEVVNSFAVVLHEEGVLSSFDPEKDKFSSFKDIIDKIQADKEAQIQAGIEAYKNSLDPDFKDLVEGKESGVSLETLAGLKLEKKALDNVTDEAIEAEENEEIRRVVITTNLKKSTNFSDEKIKKLVDGYIKSGEDIVEAKEAVANLRELNKKSVEAEIVAAKEATKKAQIKETETLAELNRLIESTTEFFPGNKADKAFKTKVFETLTKVVDKDKDGRALSALTKKRAEDPLKFDMITAALVASGAYDGKWDNVLKAQKKGIYNELEQVLKTSEKQKSGSGASRTATTSRTILESLKKQ